MKTQYKTYCRYARMAVRLEGGTLTVQMVRQEVGTAGLAAIREYLAAGKPDFAAWEAAGFSF